MVSPIWKQLFVGISPMWQQFHASVIYALIPTIISSLRLDDSPFHLTMEQESWFASVALLMMFPTNLIAGLLTTPFGRKYVYLIFLTFNFVAALLVYFAQDYHTLIVAYIFLGLTGGCGPIGTFFLAECVSPKIRGIMLDVKNGWSFLGIIAPRFITPYCSWRLLSLYSAGTIIFCIAISLYAPESPPWLASKGRFDECKTSFLWLRGEKDVAELNELIECQQNAITKQRTAIYGTQSRAAKIFTFIFDKGFLKAAFIVMLCVMFYDFTGKLLVLNYVDILNEITNDPVNYDFYFQLLGLLDLFALAVSFVAVSKFRRRTLLFGAGIPAVLFLYLFCMLTFFNTIRAPWVRFALFCLFFFFVTSGPMTILYAVQGEIFPLRHRGAGTIFTSFLFVSTSFTILKSAPRLLVHLTIQGMLFIHAIVLTACLFVLYFYLPETFNRTLQNIENELKDKLPNRDDVEVRVMNFDCEE